MKMLAMLLSFVLILGCALPVHAGDAPTPLAPPAAPTFRVCTFNLEDVRTDDLNDANQPRLKALAAIIQTIQPDILFLNEIAYDMAGAPGWVEGNAPGRNAQRFADLYLAVPQRADLKALKFKAFTAPSNTGLSSGHDLDNNGKVITAFPTPSASDARGVASEQTAEGRAYGNDCFGFGTFPGQYAFALLVSEKCTIRTAEVRTFQKFLWSAMPDAMRPHAPGKKENGETGGTPVPRDGEGKQEFWYDDAEWPTLRLSSKSHWDVPVELPGGAIIHVLCSHPTPPAFDGKEGRNKKRNHDEIRFWREYLDNRDSITDDLGAKGGLASGASFVIVGDLNADAQKGRGSSVNDPIATLLATAPRANLIMDCAAARAVEGLQPTDTSAFKLRVDYVIPSKDFTVHATAVFRDGHEITIDPVSKRITAWPSDHFPVYADLELPPTPIAKPPAAPK